MKTALCAVAVALLSTSVLAGTAKADTIVEDFTVSGTAVRNNSGLDGITSSSFADFNTAVGTLTGVTLSFAGTANYSEPIEAGDTVDFVDVTTASNVNEEIFRSWERVRRQFLDLGQRNGQRRRSFEHVRGKRNAGPCVQFYCGCRHRNDERSVRDADL